MCVMTTDEQRYFRITYLYEPFEQYYDAAQISVVLKEPNKELAKYKWAENVTDNGEDLNTLLSNGKAMLEDCVEIKLCTIKEIPFRHFIVLKEYEEVIE